MSATLGLMGSGAAEHSGRSAHHLPAFVFHLQAKTARFLLISHCPRSTAARGTTGRYPCTRPS